MSSLFADLHQGAWSAWARRRYRKAFDEVAAFCLFVGYPRSGHSLVGALLNAHREAVIAHELEVSRLVLGGCDRDTLFAHVLARAAWFDLRGNTSNYSYQVPQQWQGRFARLRVVGDKRGGSATAAIEEHPDFLDRLAATARVPLRLVHVVRNPFDNIAAISLWHRVSLDDAVAYYFRLCRTTSSLAATGRTDLLTLRHEDIVRSPRAELARACAFLDLQPDAEYLADCASIVAAAPHPSRLRVRWSPSQVAEVARRAAAVPFLASYEFEPTADAEERRSDGGPARRAATTGIWPRVVERWFPTERRPPALAGPLAPPSRDERRSSRGWDEAARRLARSGPMAIWYAYMRAVYGRLLADWLPPAADGVRLKTDLFEEAASEAHPFADLGGRRIGIDLSLGVARAARAALTDAAAVACVAADLRALPLGDGAIEAILSGSSLDHFASRADVLAGLAELARALAPGGTLVLTLDNPHNPAIWLRNRLPYRLLRACGLVPYYVGATLGRRDTARALAAVGLRVVETRAVAHAPRAPAIWLVRLLARGERSAGRLARALSACERLSRWPTRHLTAYYLAFRAVRPAEEAGASVADG